MSNVISMTPEIAAAICDVMAQVKMLGKNIRNKYDNYDAVSIDKFLHFISPICASCGISVIHQETDVEYYLNKKGAAWMRITFDFFLCHKTGSIAGPFVRHVAVPMNGAQSYGAAQSYALKQYLRGQFMIPTGDKDDADLQAPDQHQPAGTPFDGDAPQKNVSDSVESAKRAAGWVAKVKTLLGSAEHASDMADFATKNATAIERVKASNKTAFDDLMAFIDRRESELSKGAES